MSRTASKRLHLPRTLVLIGIMGAGKSAVGRRLGTLLELPFVDADEEIEAAAGCSISDIFALHGEPAFRDGEKRVIERLLLRPKCILAAGGGAFMNEDVRAAIRKRGISVWLRADLETLWQRVRRRDGRPLLDTATPKRTLEELIQRRYPVYAEADITVESSDGPPEETVKRVIEALRVYLSTESET
jgi:shikimate kinase